jgi:hypothetical protein
MTGSMPTWLVSSICAPLTDDELAAPARHLSPTPEPILGHRAGGAFGLGTG